MSAKSCLNCGKSFGFLSSGSSISLDNSIALCENCYSKIGVEMNKFIRTCSCDDPEQNVDSIYLHYQGAQNKINSSVLKESAKKAALDYINSLLSKANIGTEQIEQGKVEALDKKQFDERTKNENMILTTCSSVEGYHVTHQLGLVFGEIVFKTGYFSSKSASFDNAIDSLSFGDQELTGTSRILDNARQYAIKKMINDASSKGANAIIGINSESSGSLEYIHITIMGTAVYIEKD